MTTIGRITLTGAVLLAFVLQAYTAQTVFYQRQRDGDDDRERVHPATL